MLNMAIVTVVNTVGAYLVGRAADQGLANFFGEATCRHGTHPLAWLSIHIAGFVPAMGGNSTGGSSQEVAPMNRGWVFLARGLRDPSLSPSWKQRLFYPRFIPRSYSFLSTKSFLAKFSIPSLITIPIALLSAILVPPIRIRMAQEDLENMYEAPLMPALAVRTNKWISPLNIGTIGTLWNALHYKTPIRMTPRPSKK